MIENKITYFDLSSKRNGYFPNEYTDKIQSKENLLKSSTVNLDNIGLSDLEDEKQELLKTFFKERNESIFKSSIIASSIKDVRVTFNQVCAFFDEKLIGWNENPEDKSGYDRYITKVLKEINILIESKMKPFLNEHFKSTLSEYIQIRQSKISEIDNRNMNEMMIHSKLFGRILVSDMKLLK